MRTGHLNKGWIKNDDGEVIGIALGADFCAEHEWGIPSIRNSFKMKDKALGLERWKIRESRIDHIIFHRTIQCS